MRISMLDGRTQYAEMRQEILEAVDGVLSSGQWIGGGEVRALEEELAARFGFGHAVAVASGTDALLLALKALGVGPGVDVVVPAYTFFATAGAVISAGGRPVFADVEPVGWNLDPASFAERATASTRVVVPVDLFGQCADYDTIRRLASERGVAILEDAAQALGGSFRGRPAGTLGDLAGFSFYPTKNLGACGDAGLIATKDEALAASVRRLAAHGSDGGYVHSVAGTNSRLDAIQAAILRVKLRRLDRWQEARARAASYYTKRFSGQPGILPPSVLPEREHAFHQYVIRVERGERDGLRSHLLSRGIASGIYYPLPLHLQPCFADLGGRPGDCPVAEAAARSSLALPLHPDLSEADLDEVATEVIAWAGRQF